MAYSNVDLEVGENDGDLLLTLLWVERSAFSVRAAGYNLFVFRHALVVVRVALRDMRKGITQALTMERLYDGDMRRAAESIVGLPSAEALKHPGCRRIPWSSVDQAELRRGRVAARLILTSRDGTVSRWGWFRSDAPGLLASPVAPPLVEIETALREVLGPALSVVGAGQTRA